MSGLAGYRARWRGEDHRAAPELREDGWWVWLVRDRAADGFEAVTDDGPWVRGVPFADCDAVVHVRLAGTWRGVECHVHDDRGDDLLLQYAGSSVLEARQLGFDRVARGVHRRWVPREELRAVREESVLLAP